MVYYIIHTCNTAISTSDIYDNVKEIYIFLEIIE